MPSSASFGHPPISAAGSAMSVPAGPPPRFSHSFSRAERNIVGFDVETG